MDILTSVVGSKFTMETFLSLAIRRGDDSEFSAAAVRSVNRRVWSPHPGQRLFRVRACIYSSMSHALFRVCVFAYVCNSVDVGCGRRA